MATIQQELWNIFSYYTLHGNPKDPSKMASIPLSKFCKDSMIFDAAMTERPMTQADLNLIFTSEIKSPQKTKIAHAEKGDKLNFDEFLSCLTRIAMKCYPSCATVEDGMQQLLMDNILPLALRRKPLNISAVLIKPAIVSLFSYYEDALLAIFRFYSTSSDNSARGRTLLRSTNTMGKSFDEQKKLIEEAKEITQLQNSMTNSISHADFLRFAGDYGLTGSIGLTTLDLGDIYLSVIAFDNFTTTVRNMEFREFWEAIVRCALVSHKSSTHLSDENKVKGLLLSIWKHLQSCVQDSTANIGTVQGGGFNTYKSGLIHGSQLLNERFIAAWSKEGYKDYDSDVVNYKPKAGVAESVNKFDEEFDVIKDLLSDPEFNDLVNQSNLMEPETSAKAASTPAVDDSAEGSKSNNNNNLEHITIKTDISDEMTFDDERITPALLRRLLTEKKDIAVMLYQCMKESNILDGDE